MKRVLLYIVLLVVAAGCSGRREIPRNDLAKIFRDAYLVNAYYQNNSRTMYAVQMDSLDIYRPILERYGYSLRDLEYTVQQISKQKSRNLSDIVEMSIEQLKRESGLLDERVAALDTVNARAGRMFMQRILFEQQITADEVADTSRLRITVPLREGNYEVSYKYLLDSLEENSAVRIVGTIIDTTGRRRQAFSQSLAKLKRQSPEPQKFETTAADSALILLLGNYPVKEMKRPGLTVDSLEVTYFLPQQMALDSLMKTFIHLDLFPENETQVSSPLRPDPIGIDSVGGSDAL